MVGGRLGAEVGGRHGVDRRLVERRRVDGLVLLHDLVVGRLVDGPDVDRAHLDRLGVDGKRLDGADVDRPNLDGWLVDRPHLDGELVDGPHVDQRPRGRLT